MATAPSPPVHAGMGQRLPGPGQDKHPSSLPLQALWVATAWLGWPVSTRCTPQGHPCAQGHPRVLARDPAAQGWAGWPQPPPQKQDSARVGWGHLSHWLAVPPPSRSLWASEGGSPATPSHSGLSGRCRWSTPRLLHPPRTSGFCPAHCRNCALETFLRANVQFHPLSPGAALSPPPPRGSPWGGLPRLVRATYTSGRGGFRLPTPNRNSPGCYFLVSPVPSCPVLLPRARHFLSHPSSPVLSAHPAASSSHSVTLPRSSQALENPGAWPESPSFVQKPILQQAQQSPPPGSPPSSSITATTSSDHILQGRTRTWPLPCLLGNEASSVALRGRMAPASLPPF